MDSPERISLPVDEVSELPADAAEVEADTTEDLESLVAVEVASPNGVEEMVSVMPHAASASNARQVSGLASQALPLDGIWKRKDTSSAAIRPRPHLRKGNLPGMTERAHLSLAVLLLGA